MPHVPCMAVHMSIYMFIQNNPTAPQLVAFQSHRSAYIVMAKIAMACKIVACRIVACRIMASTVIADIGTA